MRVVRTVHEMQTVAAELKRSGQRIALVPTMGALHEGHASLMRKAREQEVRLVVSIYVNPTQFGPHDDFKKYPRNLEGDTRVCEREGVEVLFVPPDDEMYPGGALTDLGGRDETGNTLRGRTPARTFPRGVHHRRETFQYRPA